MLFLFVQCDLWWFFSKEAKSEPKVNEAEKTDEKTEEDAPEKMEKGEDDVEKKVRTEIYIVWSSASRRPVYADTKYYKSV